MRFSKLQKYILMQCYNSRGYRLDRSVLLKFYGNKKNPSKDLRVKIITKSIERLIEKELMIGHGVRTAQKWYIKEIRLTNKGVKLCKKFLGEQLRLPIIVKK